MSIIRRPLDPLMLAILLLASREAAAEAPPASAAQAPESQRPLPRAPGPRASAHLAVPGASGQAPSLDQRRERIRERIELMRDRIKKGKDRRSRVHSAEREMLEELRREKVNPEELKQKLLAFEALRAERRREHRIRLHSRWGKAVTRPEVKGEIEQHGRRLARLRRMEVLAATERSGKQQTNLMGRIRALRELEEQRHQKVMQGLVPNAPGATPGAAAAPSLPGLPSRQPAAVAAPSASGDRK